MLRDNPNKWASLCREQAAVHPDPKIACLLMQLAEQCDALALRLGEPPADAAPDEHDGSTSAAD